MSHSIQLSIATFTLAASLVACVAPDDGAGDLSDTAQLSTDPITSCVDSTHPFNAEIWVDDYPGAQSTYTRTPSTSCDSKTTIVDMHLDPPPPVDPGYGTDSTMWAQVVGGTWGLESTFTTAQKKAECENSTLAMRVLDHNGNQIYYGEDHPTWSGSECGYASLYFVRPAGNNSEFTVRALAIRGQEENHHGYARVEIGGEHGYVHY